MLNPLATKTSRHVPQERVHPPPPYVTRLGRLAGRSGNAVQWGSPTEAIVGRKKQKKTLGVVP